MPSSAIATTVNQYATLQWSSQGGSNSSPAQPGGDVPGAESSHGSTFKLPHDVEGERPIEGKRPWMPIQRVQTHPRPTHLLQHLGSYLLERSRNSGDGTTAEGNHENLQELEGTKVYGLQESNEEVVDACQLSSGPTKKLLMSEFSSDSEDSPQRAAASSGKLWLSTAAV